MQEESIVPRCSSENHHQKMHVIDVNHHETGILFDFSQLPWVVFLTILKFFKTDELCRLCLVNKRWQKACLDPCLWRNLDLMKYHSISDDDLIRLTSYSSNVVKLKISQDVDACNLLTDLGFSQVLQQCPSLVECSIFNCRELSDDVLATLGECCHFLRKLDITLSIRFTDEGIRKVCEGCPELEEIIMDQCADLTNEALVHLGRHSRMLKYISGTSITNITDQGVLALLQGCEQLRTLRLPLCGLSGHSTRHIVQYCTDIVYIDIRGVTLEDSDIHNLVMSLTEIETLNLGLCYNLTDASVMEIAKYFKKIKHLFLVNTKVTDEGLFQLSAYSQNLVHLDVSWCQGVTQVGATKILSGCPKLKHLGLFRCDKVPESAVNELSSKFPHVFISTLQTEMKKSAHRKPSREDSS